MTRERSAWLLVLGLVFALAARPAAAADAPQELLVQVRTALAPVTDLAARFEQTSYLAAAGLETQVRGTVELTRGGRMHWSYVGEYPQEIVSDGTTLWFYQVRDRTVLRQELAGLPPASRLALDVLGGFAGIEEHFALTSCGEACLELTPREPQPDLSKLQVELTAERLVASVTTEDTLGNRTRVAFEDVKRNPGLGAERFLFTPPQGVEVLDLEQQR